MTFTWSDTISRYLYEYVLLAVAYILCWLRGSVVIVLGLSGFDKKFISFKTSRVWCRTHVLSVFFCKWMRAYVRLIYACLVSCLSQLSAVLSVQWCVHTLVCPFLNSSPPSPPSPFYMPSEFQLWVSLGLAFGIHVQRTPLALLIPKTHPWYTL